MAGNAMVRVTAGQHGAAEGRAERETGNRMVKVDSRAGENVNVGRVNVRVAVATDGEGTELVTQKPDDVRLGARRRIGFAGHARAFARAAGQRRRSHSPDRILHEAPAIHMALLEKVLLY